MNKTTPGNPLRSRTLWILASLLLATGCAQNPDIRSSRDGTSGLTTRSDPEYLGCVKDGIRPDARTYVQEEDGRTLLFVGNTDPNLASGLVELSSTQAGSRFSVYQRNAWQDKGRLINAARMCSRA